MNYYSNQTVFANSIPCVIEEGKIFQTDYLSGNKTQVGVSLEEYNSKVDMLDEYYNKLVEVGVIEKEKTQEEIQKEQNELINKLLTKIENLEKKVSDKNVRDDKKSSKDGRN